MERFVKFGTLKHSGTEIAWTGWSRYAQKSEVERQTSNVGNPTSRTPDLPKGVHHELARAVVSGQLQWSFFKGGIAMMHRLAFVISLLMASASSHVTAGTAAPESSDPSQRPVANATFSMF